MMKDSVGDKSLKVIKNWAVGVAPKREIVKPIDVSLYLPNEPIYQKKNESNTNRSFPSLQAIG